MRALCQAAPTERRPLSGRTEDLGGDEREAAPLRAPGQVARVIEEHALRIL
ncbi:hypothetical protein GCM10010412_012280 [Nonomuraea recticatena]|uniref:Uncharacterized protein n=1 Tax=Nonomuraea recticatena TaxID=46178 RepID=A0ABN3RAY2_9ACTN